VSHKASTRLSSSINYKKGREKEGGVLGRREYLFSTLGEKEKGGGGAESIAETGKRGNESSEDCVT